MSETDTQFLSQPQSDSTSAILGVSVRAWIAVSLVITVCLTHLAITVFTLWDSVKTGSFDKVGTLTTIGEPLYSMAVGALGFYFGQKTSKK